jgi:hypothetical protein
LPVHILWRCQKTRKIPSLKQHISIYVRLPLDKNQETSICSRAALWRCEEGPGRER